MNASSTEYGLQPLWRSCDWALPAVSALGVELGQQAFSARGSGQLATCGVLFVLILALAPAEPQRADRVAPGLSLSFLMLCLGFLTASPVWALVGGLLLVSTISPWGAQRARAIQTAATLACATLGAGALVLRYFPEVPEKIFFAALQALRPVLRRVSGISLTAGETLVLDGHPVHLTTLLPLGAILPLVAVLAWYKKRTRLLLLLLGVLATLAVLVRVLAVMLFLDLNHPNWLIGNPAYALIADLLPATLLALAFVKERIRQTTLQVGRRSLLASVAAGSIAVLGLEPAIQTRPQHLQILIDDAHGNWEPSSEDFGDKVFGRASVYNYALLREWLEARYEVAAVSTAPINPKGDLLIVKTPALAYSDSEREAIRSWVRKGGSLLIFADHTDLFGTTDNLNQLLQNSGIQVRSDAALPFSGITRNFRSGWWNWSLLVRENSTFEVLTSASLDLGAISVAPLLVDMGVTAERAQYSNDRNFGDLSPSIDDRQPPIVVAAAANLGRGRVVVIADSTPWSNFAFFKPPNPEFLDAAVRVAVARKLTALRVLAGVVLLSILAMSLLSRSAVPLLAGLASLASTVAILGTLLHPTPMPPRQGADLMPRLIVDQTLGATNWSTDVATFSRTDELVYSAFLSWISRAGYEPVLRSKDVFSSPNVPVLIVNPRRHVSTRYAASAEQFVRSGGHLLILDDPQFSLTSTAEDLLSRFGVAYSREIVNDGIYSASGPILPKVVFALPFSMLSSTRRQPGQRLASLTSHNVALDGVQPILVDRNGLIVYGKRRVGRGSVSVFLRSSLFCQSTMGDVWGGTEPGTDKESIYALEFAMLRDLFGAEETTEIQR